MNEGSSPRATFEALWQKSGLAKASTIEVAATITAETLAADHPTEAREADPAATRGLEDAAPGLVPDALTTLPSLPRLSIDGEGGPKGGEASSAELHVVGLLGEGGMGRVLLAKQRSLGREVAVKVLRKNELGPATATAAALLLAEARMTGFLEHPSIVPVHALGRDEDGLPVLVMKRIEGVPWDTLLSRPDHPAWQTIPSAHEDRLGAQIDILIHVCNALHFAHSRGIVHRDIKPENVMIGSFGEVYLADWGVATRMVAASGKAHAGPIVGTPAFMAPEMLSGDLTRIDARTDVFLLGATLHQVVTGEHKNPGATLQAALLAAWEAAPVDYPASVPPELAAICRRATQREPADRYPSALALRQSLTEFLHHRHAIRLAEVAFERLRELRELLTQADADVRKIYRLSSECRFAFAESLREYAENAVARRGLQQTLEALIELEISRENADGALALLAELPEARPELATRVAAIASVIEKRREREARLVRLEHEFDPSVSARPRMWFFTAVLGTSLTFMSLAVYRHVTTGSSQMTPEQLLRASFQYLAVVAIVLVVGRKQLFATTINRRIVAALCTALLSSTIHRVIGYVQHSDVPSVMTGDLLMLAAITAVGSFTITRGLWPLPVGYAIAMLTGVLFGQHLPLIFGLANIFALSYAAWTWNSHSGLLNEPIAKE